MEHGFLSGRPRRGGLVEDLVDDAHRDSVGTIGIDHRDLAPGIAKRPEALQTSELPTEARCAPSALTRRATDRRFREYSYRHATSRFLMSTITDAGLAPHVACERPR